MLGNRSKDGSDRRDGRPCGPTLTPTLTLTLTVFPVCAEAKEKWGWLACWQDAVSEPDTFYVKIDDDIVFIEVCCHQEGPSPIHLRPLCDHTSTEHMSPDKRRCVRGWP